MPSRLFQYQRVAEPLLSVAPVIVSQLGANCEVTLIFGRQDRKRAAILAHTTSLAFCPFTLSVSILGTVLQQTQVPLFKSPYPKALFARTIIRPELPLLGPRVAGNRTAVITTIYQRTGYGKILMPAALITRVTKYRASINPNTKQEASTQPEYNQ